MEINGMTFDSDALSIFLFIGAVAGWMLYYVVGICRALQTPYYSGDLSQRQKRVIDGKTYIFLQNIVRKVKSGMEPRPEKVIERFEKEGWIGIVCDDAQDVWGNPAPECQSLWGRKK